LPVEQAFSMARVRSVSSSAIRPVNSSASSRLAIRLLCSAFISGVRLPAGCESGCASPAPALALIEGGLPLLLTAFNGRINLFQFLHAGRVGVLAAVNALSLSVMCGCSLRTAERATSCRAVMRFRVMFRLSVFQPEMILPFITQHLDSLQLWQFWHKQH
jgi:hypothetical protein